MLREESQYPQDWFRIGEKELKRARNLLGLGDLEGAAFNIQQAVEKYLKGFLLSKGWKLQKTHDLEPLLNEAARHAPQFVEFREACLKMTEYYVEERYPTSVLSELTRGEIEASLGVAERIIDIVKASTT